MASSLASVGRRGALAALLLLLAVPTAALAGIGDVYVLDYARPDPAGTIYEVDPDTGNASEICPLGEDVCSADADVEVLYHAVGITVDEEGTVAKAVGETTIDGDGIPGGLVVAQADGYNDTYFFEGDPTPYDCGTGCGAILWIDPSDGHAHVVSRGKRAQNPYGVVIDDSENALYIADAAGTGNIFRVDLNAPDIDDNQGAEPYLGGHSVPGSGPGHGLDSPANLRSPWDLALAENGDLLVTNTGTPGVVSDVDCNNNNQSDDPEQSTGFVARVRDDPSDDPYAGEVSRFYCDDDFARPKGLTVGADGTMYVSDPFTVQEGANGDPDYASLFKIKDKLVPAPGPGDVADVQLLTGGGLFAGPVGLAASYSGKSVLVADESAFTLPDCNAFGGCGGLIAVDPFGGDQAMVADLSLADPPAVDPLDVAVDRRAAPLPLPKQDAEIKLRRLPYFNRTDLSQTTAEDAEDFDYGLVVLRLRGFVSRAKTSVKCLHGCADNDVTPKPAHPDRGQKREFKFPFSGEDVSHVLRGKFQVVTSVEVDKKAKVRYKGRFRRFRFEPGVGAKVEQLPEEDGCLEPGKSRVVFGQQPRRTVVGCGKKPGGG